MSVYVYSLCSFTYYLNVYIMYNHTTFREIISDVTCSNIITQTCRIDTLNIFFVASVVALRKRFVVVGNLLFYIHVGINHLIKCLEWMRLLHYAVLFSLPAVSSGWFCVPSVFQFSSSHTSTWCPFYLSQSGRSVEQSVVMSINLSVMNNEASTWCDNFQ